MVNSYEEMVERCLRVSRTEEQACERCIMMEYKRTQGAHGRIACRDEEEFTKAKVYFRRKKLEKLLT